MVGSHTELAACPPTPFPLAPPGGGGLESPSTALLKGGDPKPKPCEVDATRPAPARGGRWRCQGARIPGPSPQQNVIAEHEIRNISCAAQDPEDLCTFAYITKDLQTGHHYCHVFSTVDVVGSLGARLSPRSCRCPLCAQGGCSEDSGLSRAQHQAVLPQ